MAKETPEERAERILAELREATAEAAGVAKDLRAAAKAAREQIDNYLGTEVNNAHKLYTQQWQASAEQFIADMRSDVTQHITDWTAVVQNEISRTAIFKEAVNQILSELKQYDAKRLHQASQMAPGVVISMCDRPHAD